MPGVGAVARYVKLPQTAYREEIDRMLKELDREQPGIVDEMVKIHEAAEHYSFEQLDNPPSKITSQRVVDFFNQTGTEEEVWVRDAEFSPRICWNMHASSISEHRILSMHRYGCGSGTTRRAGSPSSDACANRVRAGVDIAA